MTEGKSPPSDQELVEDEKCARECAPGETPPEAEHNGGAQSGRYYLYVAHGELSPSTVFFEVADESHARVLCELFAAEYSSVCRITFQYRESSSETFAEDVLLREALDDLDLYDDPDPGIYELKPPQELLDRAQCARRAQVWLELLERQAGSAPTGAIPETAEGGETTPQDAHRDGKQDDPAVGSEAKDEEVPLGESADNGNGLENETLSGAAKHETGLGMPLPEDPVDDKEELHIYPTLDEALAKALAYFKRAKPEKGLTPPQEFILVIGFLKKRYPWLSPNRIRDVWIENYEKDRQDSYTISTVGKTRAANRVNSYLTQKLPDLLAKLPQAVK